MRIYDDGIKPLYDETLPCYLNTYTYTQTKPIRYLGSPSTPQSVYITLNLTTDDAEKIRNLYDFWNVSCNVGTTSFVIEIDLFGEVINAEVKFLEDLVVTNDGMMYNSTVKLVYVSRTRFVVDDLGVKIVDDDGKFIIDDKIEGI